MPAIEALEEVSQLAWIQAGAMVRHLDMQAIGMRSSLNQNLALRR